MVKGKEGFLSNTDLFTAVLERTVISKKSNNNPGSCESSTTLNGSPGKKPPPSSFELNVSITKPFKEPRRK